MILSGYPDYPDETEVAVTMQSTAFWPTTLVKQQFALRQAYLGARKAARSWEHLTGWLPFLSSGETQTRRFNLRDVDHNGDLDLQGGLISLASVSLSGTLQNRDFTRHLYPLNARFYGSPHTMLQGAFARGNGARSYGLTGSGGGGEIAITGVWGYSLTVPEDVYDGLRLVASQTVLQTIENLQSVGSISQDGFSKSFDIVGIVTQKDLVSIWGKDYNTLVATYFRVAGF